MVDASESQLQIQMAKAGIWLTFGVCIAGLAYCAATWEHPNRPLIMAMFAGGFIGGLVIAALPIERIVRSRFADAFFANGFLPAPFVFDVGDTFMDWFNTAYWAHNPGAYSVWGTIYLPLSFVLTGLLAATMWMVNATSAQDSPFDPPVGAGAPAPTAAPAAAQNPFAAQAASSTSTR